MEIRGLIPATVTPFGPDWSIDFDSLERHFVSVANVDGVFGIAVNGNAGEILALSSEERASVTAFARKTLPSDRMVIAGIEAHSPDALVREGKHAREAGADALLVLPPFDIRQYRGLTRFPEHVYPVFERLDREVGLPMIVFEYPEHAGCAYPVEVLLRLAELPNVVAIKAATGSVTPYAEVYDALHDKVGILPANDAPSLLGMLLYGAVGSLIGVGVVGTSVWSELVKEATTGSAQRAKEIFNRVCVRLTDAIFDNQRHRSPFSVESATKEALVLLGQIASARVRPPLVEADDARRAYIKRTLVETGLLEVGA